ncbi:DUF58 domain-containing protein [Nocardioides caldifontis]|uniref:DUF58 domain-containing protein n=1 Tax=Nocardioides caldifontis TaxID=2588938 RepID=UPI001EEFD03E|nr:DUF58 domain-containing protein [Nocardioides caldifontis]
MGALTTRGRAFLSSGVTALLCAAVLGLDDLARVGLLLVALPLISAVVVSRGRLRLGLTRTVTPSRTGVGQDAVVRLALTNDGRTPAGTVLLEEQVPYVLGARPRFTLDRMGPRWRRTVEYRVRSEVRGRYLLGPMTVRVDDPFGLVELRRTFQSTTPLVVTPPVTVLPPIPLAGLWAGTGDNRPRDFAGGSAEDVTVREYRRGDDLRRVHWRSSAHAGELMVRREEQPWQSRATVFVDNRRHVHRGSGPGSSLEYAVAFAASVCLHLAQRGFQVRLVTAASAGGGDQAHAGGTPDHAWHQHAAVADAGPLLESLAVLADAPTVRMDTAWLADSGASGLLVAITGALDTSDQPALGRLRHAASTPMAVVLDVERWSRGGDADGARAAELLTAQGWRAVTAAPGDDPARVWQRLGLTTHRRRTATAAEGARR